MPQASFRSWIGVAKDLLNANLSVAVVSTGTTLTLNNITAGCSGVVSAGNTYTAVIVDGVNTESTVVTGNLTALTNGSTVAVTALANAHSINAYVYFQLTASIGPTAYIPVKGIDWSDEYVELYDEGQRGSNVAHYGSVQGMRHGTVNLEGDVFADTFGYLLSDFFGAYDYTATTGGNPTLYAFSPLNTGNAQPTPYLFYDYNPGNANTRVLCKAIVSDLTINADPGSLLSYTASIMAFASGVVANPATIPPAYSTFTVIPSRVASVSIGGTYTAKVQKYSLSLKRNEAGPIDTLAGIQDPLAVWSGPAEAKCKSTIVVDDDVQLLNYFNNSQPTFKVVATQGTGTAANGITIQHTKANYETVKVVQKGGAYVTLDVPFTALSNSTDKSTAGGGLSPVLLTLSTGTTTGATLY